MATVGTSIASTNSSSFSSKDDTSTCNATTTSTTTINTNTKTANTNSIHTPLNHSTPPPTANTNTLLSESSRQNKVDLGNHLQKEHQISAESTQTQTNQQQQQTDHEFFRKLLQHNENMDHYNQLQHIPSSSSLVNMTAPDSKAALSNPVTSIFGASGSTSLIEHLMPSDHQQSPPPWSTYSMPIFPSFSMDMNYDGENTMINDQASILSSKINNDSSRILSVGSNLIGRFNQSNSDNNAILSSASGGSIIRMNRQDNSLGSERSYSNVLHSQHDVPIHERLSMFNVQQQQHQQSQISDMNAITTAPLTTHSSLTPTNHHRQQTGLSSSSASSSTSSNQYQNQQQARRANEFMSTNQQQQAYQQMQTYQQQTNSTATFNSGTNQAQPSNGGSSLSPLGGNYFFRGVLGNFNVEKQQSNINSGSSVTLANANNGPNKRRNKLPFFTGTNVGGGSDSQNQVKVDLYGSALVNSDGSERFSRKVFVGGLPPDIDEEEIKASFRRFGSLIVDWPHKAESKSYFPPKGYAFLLFHEESSVQALIDACLLEDDKLYLCVSSPTIKDKPVQIRPWRLSDADFVLDSTLALDPRKTVFVGGVPRPLKASELANIMNNLYGGVCYAGIDTDPELKYPKGAGRVAFSNHQSYIAAISARFVHLHHSEIEKRVEVKPYVLDDQVCDECQGTRCGNKFAPFFCANITCLQYYCENCWSTIHSQPGREFHKPLVKEGADRPRGVPFRWC